MSTNEYNQPNEIIDKIKVVSVARGDFTDDSDIDIAMIKDSDQLTAKMYNDVFI